MARTLTAALGIMSMRLAHIARLDQPNRNLKRRRDSFVRTACGSGRLICTYQESAIFKDQPPATAGGSDKTLVASRGLAYYDRLAVAFETSLSERLSNYVGSDHSFLFTALSVAGTGRSGTQTVYSSDTDTYAASDGFARGL